MRNNLFCFCKKELKDNLTTPRGLRVVLKPVIKMVKYVQSVTMNVFMRFALRASVKWLILGNCEVIVR